MKKKNIIITLLIFICLIGLSISIFNIVRWLLDSNNTEKQIQNIQKITDIEIIDNTDEITVIEQSEEIDKENPYYDYMKMNLIDVDFTELKKINNQTKGWIQVNGTKVNYPFVQANDNNYYLNHSFDKSYNRAGWVYLDYRNNIESLNKNIIIYAHGRYDKTMFGTLKHILENGWINDINNHIIKLSTENENTLWQVFSVYKTPTTSDYLKVDFNSNTEFKEFADMLINRSAHNFNTSISETDNILTLSTCYTSDIRIVIHAKMIKKN